MNESMHSRLVVSARCASVLLLLLACAGGARAECPSVEHAAKTFQLAIKKPIEVRRVVPSAVDGICEVHTKLEGRYLVTDMNAAGTHIFTGQMIEAATNRNLTNETIDSLNVFTPEDFAKVVDQSVELLKNHGISGTPSYILPDRRTIGGFRDAAALRKLLESSAAPAKSAPAAPPAQ